MTSVLPVDKINVSQSTQPRASLVTQVVEDYASAMADGATFPPVTVFFDGHTYWLGDGFHRVAAAGRAAVLLGRDEVAQIECDVRQGTQRDAEFFSFGANADHGLQRSDADKRRAIMIMLSDSEWGSWSDRNIARQCRVHHTTVARVRADAAAFFRGESRNEGGKYRPGREVVYDSGMVDKISTGHVASEERTYKTKHGTKATMDTAKIGKSSGGQQAEFDRQRKAMADNLPDSIKAMETAKAERRAAKAGGHDDLDALTAERDELREANAALEADLAEARRQVAKYDDMAVQFEQGGFDKVIAGKDEEIRVLESRLYSTNRDMASWMKKAKWEEKEKLRYKAEAEKRGYSDDIDMDDIDPETGEMIDG